MNAYMSIVYITGQTHNKIRVHTTAEKNRIPTQLIKHQYFSNEVAPFFQMWHEIDDHTTHI